jgi:hypothetical protein
MKIFTEYSASQAYCQIHTDYKQVLQLKATLYYCISLSCSGNNVAARKSDLKLFPNAILILLIYISYLDLSGFLFQNQGFTRSEGSIIPGFSAA